MSTQVTENYPEFDKNAFQCPYCHVHTRQYWERVEYRKVANKFLSFAKCERCKNSSLWLYLRKETLLGVIAEGGQMIYPDSSQEPLPSDASKRVREIYDEAGTIASRSPRAAAALLRLAIEVLCKDILKDEKTDKTCLKDMIEKIAKEHNFNQIVLEAMDNVRILGNEAVHKGEIDLQDETNPVVLFWLVRYIVNQALTQHREAEGMNQLVKGKNKKKEINENAQEND